MLYDILKQRIADERKLQIVTAALELMLQKGILNVSMNEVIDHSGLSKGGVYYHFRNKDEIICSIIQAFCDFKISITEHYLSADDLPVKVMMNSLLSVGPEPSEDTSKWTRLGFDFISLAADNPHLKQILSDFYKNLLNILYLMLINGQKRGEIKKSIDPMQVAKGILAIFDGQGVASIFNHNDGINPIEVSKLTVMQLLDGISD